MMYFWIGLAFGVFGSAYFFHLMKYKITKQLIKQAKAHLPSVLENTLRTEDETVRALTASGWIVSSIEREAFRPVLFDGRWMPDRVPVITKIMIMKEIY